MPGQQFAQFFPGRRLRYSMFLSAASVISVWVVPFLQRFSSASSLWTVSFNDLFFSFSFSYFFFHCSAVSSRFTDTVFLMVLALIEGMQGQTEKEQKKKRREWNSVRVEGWEEKREKRKCERTAENRRTVNKGISALAAQWKWIASH